MKQKENQILENRMMRLRLTFENNAVYVNTSTKMKMRAVVSGLKPRHFDVVCEASRWRIVKEKTKEYMEIDSRNIVIQEQRKKELSFDNVVSISDLESASRHKPRDWDCTLRGRVVSVGGRRLAKSASNSFILELTDKNLISSVRVVFQGTSFMRYYSCLRYGDVVMISHLRRKQIRFRGENEFDFRIMAATPKKTCIYIVKSDKSMVSSTAKLSESNTIPSRKTVTITGWIGDIHGNGQFSILSEEPSNLDDHHFDLSPRDPEFRVYITGSTAVPFEGLGFRKGTKVRLCHVRSSVRFREFITLAVTRIIVSLIYISQEDHLNTRLALSRSNTHRYIQSTMLLKSRIHQYTDLRSARRAAFNSWN